MQSNTTTKLSMQTVRFGIAGLGAMGSSHADNLSTGKVARAELTAVADPFADLSRFEEQGIRTFRSSEEMIRSGEIDCVLIATPHYSHTDLGILALEQGLHVLVEKPISVHKADAERLLAAHTDKSKVFAAMFNLRTDAAYARLRSLIQQGELGEIHRINWIITTWYRTQAYYNSGGWRATWEGEGGGVLLNQCPHNLDMLYWLFGMPSKVYAKCQLGRYHDIEVEDAVTAFLEYPNGATGVFVTSTAEAAGTNRLEIMCDRGRVTLENGKINWKRTESSIMEDIRTTTQRMRGPNVWDVEVPYKGDPASAIGILRNVVEAILDGSPLLSPAHEGIHSIELANAMLMSGFEDRTIELPMDSAAYEALLQQKICESRERRNKNQ